MDQIEDRRVVEDVLCGDKDAFGILVRRYQKPIYNLMLRACNQSEEAADLTQETFVKAYEKLELFKKDRSFFTWLYSIGVNHVRDYLRQNRPMLMMSEEDLDREIGSADPDGSRDRLTLLAESEWLAAALRRLPLDFREAVMLRYNEERSMKEVANVLGIGESAAKMRVHRGLDKLRRMWRKENHERKEANSRKSHQDKGSVAD